MADPEKRIVIKARRHEVAATRRAAIDAELAHMANDHAYQEEAQQIAEDFAEADWDALQTGLSTQTQVIWGK